ARLRGEGAAAPAAATRHPVGVQRRAREPPRPVAAAGVPPAAARRAARGGHGAARRVVLLGVAAVWQLLGRDGRRADAVGAGRLALGRRPLDVDAGPRALRSPGPSRRDTGGEGACWRRGALGGWGPV